jgi:hypothetical protein
MLEPVAVAVHLQDVNMMGNPVEQRAGKSLGAEDLNPLFEGKIAGDRGRSSFVALAEGLEEQLGAGLRQRHEARFIDNEQLAADGKSNSFEKMTSYA